MHLPRHFAVSGTAALRAGDFHIWQELHVQADLACTVTYRAAEFSCVIGKIPCLIAQFFCLLGPGKNLSQFVVDIGIGGHCGTHINSDWRSIN